MPPRISSITIYDPSQPPNRRYLTRAQEQEIANLIPMGQCAYKSAKKCKHPNPVRNLYSAQLQPPCFDCIKNAEIAGCYADDLPVTPECTCRYIQPDDFIDEGVNSGRTYKFKNNYCSYHSLPPLPFVYARPMPTNARVDAILNMQPPLNKTLHLELQAHNEYRRKHEPGYTLQQQLYLQAPPPLPSLPREPLIHFTEPPAAPPPKWPSITRVRTEAPSEDSASSTEKENERQGFQMVTLPAEPKKERQPSNQAQAQIHNTPTKSHKRQPLMEPPRKLKTFHKISSAEFPTDPPSSPEITHKLPEISPYPPFDHLPQCPCLPCDKKRDVAQTVRTQAIFLNHFPKQVGIQLPKRSTSPYRCYGRKNCKYEPCTLCVDLPVHLKRAPLLVTTRAHALLKTTMQEWHQQLDRQHPTPILHCPKPTCTTCPPIISSLPQPFPLAKRQCKSRDELAFEGKEFDPHAYCMAKTCYLCSGPNMNATKQSPAIVIPNAHDLPPTINQLIKTRRVRNEPTPIITCGDTKCQLCPTSRATLTEQSTQDMQLYIVTAPLNSPELYQPSNPEHEFGYLTDSAPEVATIESDKDRCNFRCRISEIAKFMLRITRLI